MLKEKKMKLGVWTHPYSTLKESKDLLLDSIAWLEKLKSAGITLFAPFLIDGAGDHYFESEVLGSPKVDMLAPLLEAAEKVGIELHVTLPIGSVFLKKRGNSERGKYMPVDILGRNESLPDWAEDWFCPAWEEGRSMAAAMVADMIGRYKLGGINLDYVRYPNSDVAELYPCGCADCRSKRKEWFGKEVPHAFDWDKPEYLKQEFKMRSEFVTDLVERISTAVHNADVKLSVCARARYYKDGIPEGQDWAKWAQDGVVDMVWPMSYNPCFDRYTRFVEQHTSLLKDSPAEYWVGVGRSSSLGPIDTDMMIRQIKYAAERGADGVMIFHAGVFDETDYSALRELPSL